jgi:acyl-homoserine-lactone acylase
MPAIAKEVEIRRTSYGVPHILGQTLEAASFGLAWVMMEDYGEVVPMQLKAARGEWATVAGPPAVPGDYAARMAHDFAVEVFPTFPADVQAVLSGFAQGVNAFIAQNADQLPEWATADFTPQDIAARDLRVWDAAAVRNFARGRDSEGESQGLASEQAHPTDGSTLLADPDAGSNAWAFAPQRTVSGNAILVRNPHLSYTSGYYEAHMTVPGVLNFYGDFRLGGPFTIIGGFNDRLGWSTTNNSARPNQVYALLKDSGSPDRFRFGGEPQPIETRAVTVEYRSGDTLASATDEFRFTSLGPVLFETSDTVYVLKTPTLGRHRLGEQWLRMMQAQDLEEWKEAMRIQAKYSSNFTYADADGNIFYVWNAALPLLPHEPSDGAPVVAHGPADVWTETLPWDELPQLLNPEGGYLQNANDPPFFTNLNEILSPEDYPPNLPEARLRFRSQNSLRLVHTDEILTLEDVVELKHDMTMMMADRLKDDLVAILQEAELAGEEAATLGILVEWDNRVARDSRGASVFELWAYEYLEAADPDSISEVEWSFDQPTQTPRGIGDPEAAVTAFQTAVTTAIERYGTWDVRWGDVHRIRAGDLDVGVGGCSGTLGCFRVVGFRDDEDGIHRARTGDAWVLAVEFANTPRAYSVLLYGNSNKEDSPYFYDQAEMFANNRMKRVAYSEPDIQQDLVERYHPGEERRR